MDLGRLLNNGAVRELLQKSGIVGLPAALAHLASDGSLLSPATEEHAPPSRSGGLILRALCLQADELLREHHIAKNALIELRKLMPDRQVEAAKIMIATGDFRVVHARALLLCTPTKRLALPRYSKLFSTLTAEMVARMETDALETDAPFFTALTDEPRLTLCLAISGGLLRSCSEQAVIVRHMAQLTPRLLAELQPTEKY